MDYHNLVRKLGADAAKLQAVVEKLRNEDLQDLDNTIKDRVNTKLGELETSLQTFANEAAAGAIASALETGGDIDVAIDGGVDAAIDTLEITMFNDPGSRDAVSVAYGTTEADAIAALPTSVEITGGNGNTATVNDITWTIENYDPDTAGDYNAVGVFTLPHLWTGYPELYDTVTVETAPA